MNQYTEKLEAIKQVLGERYVMHPNYKPLHYHSTTYRNSFFLAAVRAKAVQENRLVG